MAERWLHPVEGWDGKKNITERKEGGEAEKKEEKNESKNVARRENSFSKMKGRLTTYF